MSNKSAKRYRPTGVEQNGTEFCFNDDYLESQCPNLYDLLARISAEGQSVKPASLSFFGQDGKFTACVNWDQEGLILFCALDGPEDCFDALEAKLGTTKPGWRKKKPTNTRFANRA